MIELLNEICDAELFFGTEVRDISEQLSATEDYLTMVSIIESFCCQNV